jgi:hypothetical protein
MSYNLYINGNQIELSDNKPIAQTKQVNDLARLDNRQSNFTNKFIIPPTPSNVRAMDKVYLTGSQSNLPYQKNTANLFDLDTGLCLIYQGWAIIKGSSNKGYEVHVYDGNIDFFKSIENKSLTDIGIAELNHVKNLANVVASFDNLKNYKYIIADYNGKNIYGTTQINIDFQLPSARVSYLWNRIFEYSGFTFSGSTFQTEAFTNLWMTFPKPVPTSNPIVTPITDQLSEIEARYLDQVNTLIYLIKLLPETVNTPEISNSSVINITGAYRLKASGFYTDGDKKVKTIYWKLRDTNNVVKSTGIIESDINQSVVINATATDKLNFYVKSLFDDSEFFSSNQLLHGNIETTLDLITGYDANFEEALIDFKATDFVNEIMQRFGLTMFKDKYTNSIDFLSLDEILKGNDALDWSGKFSSKVSEKYTIGNYAQRNNFKYKYNEDNDSHNDGFIKINDVNLADNTTTVSSKIYSPDNGQEYIGEKNVYKFWNKEIKDDSTINYKELTGRYYFLRSKDHTSQYVMNIGSEALNLSQSISNFPIASYSRLKFQEIIIDNYNSIESILNKAKILISEFYLKPKDIESFNFKKLIYVEQLASFYLVNKINSFVKGRKTKCEIIEVDLFKTIDLPPPAEDTYITIPSIQVNGCEIVINFDTNATFPLMVNIKGNQNDFGMPPLFPTPPKWWETYDNTIEAVTNSISIRVDGGQFWRFHLQITGESGIINSNVFAFENIATCPIPQIPKSTYITITSLQTLSVSGNIRTIRINYISDLKENEFIKIKVTHPFEYYGSFSINKESPSANGYFDIDVTDHTNQVANKIAWFIELETYTNGSLPNSQANAASNGIFSYS